MIEMDDQNQQNPGMPATDPNAPVTPPAGGDMGGGQPTPPPAGGDMGGGMGNPMPQPGSMPGADQGGTTPPPAAPAEGGEEHPQGGMPQS